MPACLNCGTPLDDAFCPHCGQAASTRRIDGGLVSQNMAYLLFRFDKGFWLTWWRLTLNPGTFIRGFIAGQRTGCFKPVQYLLLLYTITLILVGVNHLVHGLPDDTTGSPSGDLRESVRGSMLLTLLYWVPFLTVSAAAVFFRSGYNIWEHLVVTGYGIAHLNTLLLITQVFRLVTGRSHLLPSEARWMVMAFSAAYMVHVFATTYQRTYRWSWMRYIGGVAAIALALAISHGSSLLFGS